MHTFVDPVYRARALFADAVSMVSGEVRLTYAETGPDAVAWPAPSRAWAWSPAIAWPSWPRTATGTSRS
jgi:hypothetical protein